MADHRRTKIVATVGPASRSPKMLERLISAGADVFRLNFSHGDEDSHAENIERIRAAGELMGKWVGILGDLPGPKLRLDEVEGGFVQIEAGQGADADHRRGDDRLARSAAGRLGRPHRRRPRGRSDLPRRRPGPAACARDRRRRRSAARSRPAVVSPPTRA